MTKIVKQVFENENNNEFCTIANKKSTNEETVSMFRETKR